MGLIVNCDEEGPDSEDLSSEDYYKQVSEETKRNLKQLDLDINDAASKILNEGYKELKEELALEFGMAAIRNADLSGFVMALNELAMRISNSTRSIMSEHRFREIQKNEGVVLKAVFAGMDLAKKKKS